MIIHGSYYFHLEKLIWIELAQNIFQDLWKIRNLFFFVWGGISLEIKTISKQPTIFEKIIFCPQISVFELSKCQISRWINSHEMSTFSGKTFQFWGWSAFDSNFAALLFWAQLEIITISKQTNYFWKNYFLPVNTRFWTSKMST